MSKLKNAGIEKAERKLEFTRYLQFQMSESHKKIEELQDEIFIFYDSDCQGKKLNNLKRRLEYWKGRRDTLKEIWNYKNKKGI